MKIIEVFLLIVLSLPFYGVLIWTYLDPESSALFGRRWMYEEEPQLSESAIKYHKIISLILIIVLTIIILFGIFR